VATRDDYVVDMLVDLGFVSTEDVERFRSEAESAGVGVVDLLLANRVVQPYQVAQAKAAYFGVEAVSLRDIQIPDDVIATIPRHIARKYRVVPISKVGNTLTVAVADPSDLATLDTLTHMLGGDVVFKVAPEEDIEYALNRYYGGSRNTELDQMIQEITKGEVELGLPKAVTVMDDGSTVDADAPIIKLVNQIIVDAYRMRASDIHLEPLPNRFRIRYRIDGVLHEVKNPPRRLQPAIITRLKIMSNMSIAEHRVPQDGRIQIQVDGKMLDLRVSCLPTSHGESIVMRILDKESLRLGLSELGFFADDQQTFERLITVPDGMLLITGPTGSGKTTTLYAVLNFINKPDRKIITVEDPVEYVLEGINQVQVNEAIGLTFATALRSILRQAPNIIMVGEIRDAETATIAINAALTGHLVFSTLHTNDAPSAVTRLIDIGIKPFLVASAIRAIMAQRLVRRICKKCGQPATLTDAEMRALGLEPSDLVGAKIMKGKGCPECNNTGYRGRMGIFEIFVLDDEVRRLVYEKVSSTVIKRRAREMGMRTLREDGVRKILAGMTTAEEVISVTVGDEE